MNGLKLSNFAVAAMQNEVVADKDPWIKEKGKPLKTQFNEIVIAKSRTADGAEIVLYYNGVEVGALPAPGIIVDEHTHLTLSDFDATFDAIAEYKE